MMKYKGYIGLVDYDDDAKIFHGEIIGIKDVITFQGDSVKEIEKAFKDSVDDYLSFWVCCVIPQIKNLKTAPRSNLRLDRRKKQG